MSFREYASQLDEMPQRVKDTSFNYDNFEYAQKQLSSLKRRGKKIGEFEGYSIMQNANTIFVEDSGKLLYSLDLKRGDFKFLNLVYLTQCTVWFAGVYPKGLPAHIFWNHVYAKYKSVVSDVGWTDSGARFWLNRVSEALQKKLNVYVIDTELKTFDEVKSADEILYHGNFSNDITRRSKVFCIVDKPIVKKLEESPSTIALEIGWEGEERSEAIDVLNNATFVDERQLNGNTYLHYVQQQDDYQSHSFLTADKAELAARHSFRSVDAIPGLVPRFIRENGIQTGTIWNSAKHKGVIRSWFATSIIPVYRSILSDEFQTEAGFKFWKKLVEKYTDRTLYSYDVKSKKYEKITLSQMDALRGLAHKHTLFALIK